MDFGLEGKLAFVGGASRGIGKAIALELAREGADVVVGSRSMPDLEKTAAEIVETTGRRAIPMPFDATQRDQVDSVINAAADTLGRFAHPGQQCIPARRLAVGHWPHRGPGGRGPDQRLRREVRRCAAV